MMDRKEKANILTAINNAIDRCQVLAEKAETYEEQQYFWGQADGLHSVSIMIAKRAESNGL